MSPRKPARPAASRRTTSPRKAEESAAPASRAWVCEAEVVEGLEDIARREIAIHLDNRVELKAGPQGKPLPGLVRFNYTGGLRALLRLRTVQAVYTVHRFAVPRPKALLGDQHFRRLLAEIDAIKAAHPAGSFQTLHIDAAGADSAVMLRLRQELAQRSGLKPDPEEGDLLLRLRRSPGGGESWDALLRISPRPLATRPWRVCNMEGALNATIAHAMILMTDPTPYDVFLNLGCGSGTLLIERLAYSAAKQAIGCDLNPEVLACARRNVEAAGAVDRCQLEPWDVRALPLPEGSVDALSADLPFGHLVGSHEENLALYPALLAEAGRVARRGALFVAITHEVRLMESLLAESAQWETLAAIRVAQGGLNPRIFVLRRR